MTFQDLISPRVTDANLALYGKAETYFDPSATDTPSTCTGPSVVKPIVGKSYAECAAVCDGQNDNCVGFTFFPSQICFLHRKVQSITTYTGCAEQIPDADAGADDVTRLSCVVKKTVFETLYPVETRDSLITREAKDTYCPVYDDSGIGFASPITLAASAFAEGTFIVDA